MVQLSGSEGCSCVRVPGQAVAALICVAVHTATLPLNLAYPQLNAALFVSRLAERRLVLCSPRRPAVR